MKKNWKFTALALHVLSIFLLEGCGCTSYTDDPVNVSNKNDFVRNQDEISFISNNGNVATLIVGDILCGLGDPEEFCEPQCTQTRYETCGQGIAKSLDKEFELDFSHSKKAQHHEIFYFSDCYFVDTMVTQIQTISSMVVQDSMYFGVSKILPVTEGSNQSISEFYYVDEIGPIRYILTNGEIWDRIP